MATTPLDPQRPFRGRRALVINWRDLGHSLAGGSERYAWEFARALRDGGADVEFLTARDRGQRRREVVEGVAFRRCGGQFTFYPAVWARLVWRRLRRQAPDVVYDAENGIPVFSPMLLPSTTVVILVVHHVHQQQFLTYFPKPVAIFGRWLERWLMPRVYRDVRTVAVSQSTIDQMRSQLGWCGRVEILANGTDPVEAGVIEREARPLRLLVLGRLATHKRIDLVVRAAASLRSRDLRFRDLRLDIVGRGPVEQELRELVTSLDFGGAATIHGFLDEPEKQDLIRRAALHVCASDAEGWGQVVVEVASHGVPTLARDVAGLRDSIRGGETGWLIPDSGEAPLGARAEERLVEALGDGIRSALLEVADPVRRAEVSRQCIDWSRRFTWAAMHEQAQALVSAELERRRG